MSTADITLQQAELAFAELVRSQRDKGLWFLKGDLSISVADPEAAGLLESMARVADRATWLKIRRLKLWRSTRCS